MKTFPRWMQYLTAAGVMTLTACGGGDQSAGIDGSGAPTPGVSAGPINAFGSILQNGRRYAGDAVSPAFEITEFERYQIQIREQEVEQRRRKLGSVPSSELLLLDSNEAVAEWHWRIAIPLSIPLLTLIAVPLSRVNPRQGKFGRLLPALLLYLGYYSLLIIARSALEDGKIPAQLGMWWLHGTALLLGIVLIMRSRRSAQRFQAWLAGRS